MPAKYGIKILIDFECMMDIDYAIYTLIRYKYNKKPGVFYDCYMNSEDMNLMKSIMLTRYELNPLTRILTPEYMDEADSLYKQILEADYQTILDIAEANDIFALMETYVRANDIITVTVLCKDQAQADIIKKLDSSNSFKIIISERKKVNLTKFDAIWVGKFAHILGFDLNQVKGKHIYTLRAKYNLEPHKVTEIPKLDIAIFVGKVNKIYLASAYEWFDMPVEPLPDDKEIKEDKYNDEDQYCT